MVFVQSLLLGILGIIAAHPEDDDASKWSVICIVVIVKLINSGSAMLVYLQAAEIYPTPIRTTGCGFVFCVNVFLCLPGPFITAMGKADKRVPYLFMAGLGMFGTLTSSFLPETLGCYLAETLEEASKFGSEQKYFSMKIKRESNNVEIPLQPT